MDKLEKEIDELIFNDDVIPSSNEEMFEIISKNFKNFVIEKQRLAFNAAKEEIKTLDANDNIINLGYKYDSFEEFLNEQ